jgi:tRNA (guanine-N7-)-methyltransferase
MKKRRARKRLTSTTFLHNYQKLLKNNGIIHLKTDSTFLYEYTSELLKVNNIEPIQQTDNLYAEDWVNDFLSIKTHYEQLHIDDGENINYVSFHLEQNKKLIEPDYPKDE